MNDSLTLLAHLQTLFDDHGFIQGGEPAGLPRPLTTDHPIYLKNPDWVEVQRQVAEAGGNFIPAHASGHIYTAHLRDLVTALNPRTVIPIHTFEPDEFARSIPGVLRAMDGKQMTIP